MSCHFSEKKTMENMTRRKNSGLLCPMCCFPSRTSTNITKNKFMYFQQCFYMSIESWGTTHHLEGFWKLILLLPMWIYICLRVSGGYDLHQHVYYSVTNRKKYLAMWHVGKYFCISVWWGWLEKWQNNNIKLLLEINVKKRNYANKLFDC